MKNRIIYSAILVLVCLIGHKFAYASDGGLNIENYGKLFQDFDTTEAARSYFSSSDSLICPEMSFYNNGYCYCYPGYMVRRNKCVTNTDFCIEMFGPNTLYSTIVGTCRCKEGYIIQSDTCVDAEGYCKDHFGFLSYFDRETSSCACNGGRYAYNGECVSLDTMCKVSFGSAAEVGDQEGMCQCQDGYQFNDEMTLCVEIVYECGENTKKIGKNCVCIDGYSPIQNNNDVVDCEKIEPVKKKNDAKKNIIFTDISKSLYTNAISYLYEKGVVQGYQDGSYKPDEHINRAEFTKIIIEAKYPGQATGENCFPDVQSEWFAKYVCFAKGEGIISGSPDGMFKPGNSINLAEAYKIILETYIDTPIEDLDSDNWFDKYLFYAKQHHLDQQISLEPSQLVTRGGMAQIIFLVLGGEGQNVAYPEANVSDSDSQIDIEPADMSGENIGVTESISDVDHDGVPDEYDENSTNRHIANYTFEYYSPFDSKDPANGKTIQIYVSVPHDKYTYYKKYHPHILNEDISNLNTFVIYDESVINEIAEQILGYVKRENMNPIVILQRFIEKVVYTDDINTGWDEYPKYPVETIVDEKGDCEDTSFLLAALYRRLFDTEIYLVLFSGHVGIAVAVDNDTYDMAVNQWGTDYMAETNESRSRKLLYIETTNAGWALGDVPSSLRGREYRLIKIQ